MKGFATIVFLALIVAITPAAQARIQGLNRSPALAPAFDLGSSLDSAGETFGLPGSIPTCLNKSGAPIQPNNDQVLQWKSSTPNQFADRGFIKGTLVGVYDNTRDHLHIDVYIGNGTGSTGRETDLEVIYNQEFGAVPQNLTIGSVVIACGDYITSNKQSGQFPASPLGAILHWVHKAMGGTHPGGFLMIDGRLYGQMDAPPRGGHGPLDSFFNF